MKLDAYKERKLTHLYMLNTGEILDAWSVNHSPADFRLEFWNGLAEHRDNNTPTVGLYTWAESPPGRYYCHETLEHGISFKHSLEKVLTKVWGSAGLLAEPGDTEQLSSFMDMMQDISDFASLMDTYGKPPKVGRYSGPCYGVKIAREGNISKAEIWLSSVKPEFRKDHKRVSDLRFAESVSNPSSEIRALEIVIERMKEHYFANMVKT
jgi:hypothetical protein